MDLSNGLTYQFIVKTVATTPKRGTLRSSLNGTRYRAFCKMYNWSLGNTTERFFFEALLLVGAEGLEVILKKKAYVCGWGGVNKSVCKRTEGRGV